MKQTLTLAVLALLLAPVAGAQAPAAKPAFDLEKIKAALPECGVPMKITEEAYEGSLPSGMQALIINVESESPFCEGRYLVVTRATRSYVGYPWILDGYSGSLEQKMKAFAWERLRENVAVEVGTERSPEGMRKVKVLQKTTYGPMPITGLVDDDARIFLTGSFFADLASLAAEREKMVEPILKTSPMRGSANAKVRIVEFSDFQCPSCRFGAAYMKPILEKYGQSIRYHRVDLPLTMHAWAFPAAAMGRAIYRQNPEVFWKYKDAVYESQGELNAFVVGDFATNFAADHGLDMKRFAADVDSDSLKEEILLGAGTAFTIGVGGTPAFMVNGRMVVGGTDGAVLEKYIGELLAKQ